MSTGGTLLSWRAAGAAVGLAAAGLLLVAATGPESSRAAGGSDCAPPAFAFAAGQVQIAGDVCGGYDENFRVYCDGGSGKVAVDYTTPSFTTMGNPFISPYGCASALSIRVTGNGGADRIDLSSVTAAAFPAIVQQNVLDGGFGDDTLIGSALSDNALGGTENDLLRLKDGVADTGDCGPGSDSVDSDPALDSLVNCELVNFVPTPAANQAAATPAPAKRCKRKHRKRKKCRKH